MSEHEPRGRPISMADGALSLIQEGLRGVVRLPTGTTHALDSRGFPVAVMGKTGTTSEFRDAPFVGSPSGIAGITLAAVSIPECMGYTKIVGMPVVTGLYTILLPIVAFAIFGSSRHLVVGADSATAAIIFAALTPLAQPASAQWVALASMSALLTAAFLFVAVLLRLAVGTARPVRPRALAGLYCLGAWVGLCKLPYAPLALLYLAVAPRRLGSWPRYLLAGAGLFLVSFGSAAATCACATCLAFSAAMRACSAAFASASAFACCPFCAPSAASRARSCPASRAFSVAATRASSAAILAS